MPTVSVVIPAFNAQTYLADTLNSVLASTFRDFEVIVIDDGSSDRTGEIAQGFGPPVRVIRQANAGMSASRNRGISESRGTYVALLDADDLWHPRKMELQVQAMASDASIGLCYTEFFSWDGTAEPVFSPNASSDIDARLSGWIYDKMLLTNWVLPSSAMLRRAVFDSAGYFLCEHQQTDDWEYFVRISREWRFAKLTGAMVAYRQTPGSLSRRVSAVDVGEQMRERLIARHGLESPQGHRVDLRELERRRHKGKRDFVDRHLARGDLWLGLQGALGLVVRGPSRARTALVLANSLRRRFFPRT
jgi:glycosyltransferase involved in cell wall biosynthesis